MSDKISPWAIAVHKPAGCSSYDVIREFKRNLERPYLKKIGHLGTLDPFANGLMIVTACGGSRIQDYCHKHLFKTYIAVGKLGEKTDTGDLEGDVVASNSQAQLNTVLTGIDWQQKFKQFQLKFYNQYLQRIPHFSATKHEGKKLYELARQGTKIEKPPVLRFIQQLKCIEVHDLEVRFEVACSGGTYIRQLFEDMCQELGLFGHLVKLERSQIGQVALAEAIDFESIKNTPFEAMAQVKLDHVLPLRKIVFSPVGLTRLSSGQVASGDDGSGSEQSFTCLEKEMCWALNETGQLIGLVKALGSGEFQPKVNF